MSYAQRRNLISLVSSLVVSIPYFFYTITRYQAENPQGIEEIKFWAWAIIILAAIRIVAEILGHILSAILIAIITQDPDIAGDDLLDERDKLIELKGERNSYYAFVIGFVLSLVTVIVTENASSMFAVLILFGFMAEMINLFSQFFYYRRGY